MNLERVESAPRHMQGYSSAVDFYMALACRQAAAQGETEEVFRQACKAGDVHASTAAWAPAHYPTLADVLQCSLDFTAGPAHADAMQVLLDAANGKDVGNKARELLRRMGEKWADHFAPEVSE